MKKAVPMIFFLLSVISAVSAQQQAEKTRVALIPISFSSDDQYLSVASKTVDSTLGLVLGMSGRYEVVHETTGRVPENLFMYCEKNAVPNVIYGKSFYTDDGKIAFELSVYNMEKKGNTITKKETAESVLDVFSTADSLTLSLAESFSGMRMAFGSVRLVSIGDRGAYRVRIGESVIVPEAEIIDKVLAGKRDIEIIQERMFGPYTVVTYQIEILENTREDVVFFIPGFTSEEGKHIQAKEEEIRKSLDTMFKKAGKEKALEIYNELIEKDLAVTDYSESAAEKRKELIAQRELLLR